MADGTRLRKYGVQTTIDFEVYEVDGVDLRVDWTPAAADCEIMKDGGASTQCTNTATDEGSTYSIVLTATEMEAERLVLKVVDAATKAFLDTVVIIETYGNASAQHAMDFDDAVRGGMTALPNAAADAAGGLPISDAGGLDLDTQLATTDQIGAAGAGLTNIDLPNQTMDITGSLSGSVGSVTGAVGSVTGNVGGSVDSVTGDTKQTADHTAGIADIPTVAEFEARTIVSADYFDPAADPVASVTLVDTTTTNSDMRGTNNAALASLFTGITSLAEWLGLIAGKQVGNATARTELQATGAGSGTFDETADSQEAIRDRGDAAWITGGGGGITDILNMQPVLPTSIDLANTATVRLGLILLNALDDLPSTAEITPGTISIDRKAIGGTSWSSVVSDAAMSEQAGMVYYDEVFDAGTGYAEGDSIRVTFKSVLITVAANDHEVCDANGIIFQTEIRQTMRGTNAALLAANTPTNFSVLGIESDGDLTKVNLLDGNTPQTADHTAGIADIPTVAEFNARTIPTADYFDPAVDAVASVTLVDTTTTNTDMRGTDSAATEAKQDIIDTNVDAIQAKTDDLTFTKANELDTNTKSINDVTVNGTGTLGDEWGP